MFQSFYFNLLMDLKNKGSVHCRNLHTEVPVRGMETNSITGQSVTANPLPASKNELISIHTTAVEQESRIRLATITPKRLVLLNFFFHFSFSFLSRLKLSIYLQGNVWIEVQTFAFLWRPSSTPCLLYATKPGHRFSLVHSTLPPFPCGTPTDSWGPPRRYITSSLATCFLSAQAQFFLMLAS